MKAIMYETNKYIHYFAIPDDATNLTTCFKDGGPIKHLRMVRKKNIIEIGRFMNLTILRKVN